MNAKAIEFKIRMLADNAPELPQFELENVQALFLPSKTTFLIQPLDCTI